MTVTLPDEDTVISVQQNYDTFTADSVNIATPLMATSILTGLAAAILEWQYINDESFKSGCFNCPTYNCTYGAYTTINICSDCLNRNRTVELQQGTWTLPNSTLTLRDDAGLVNFTTDTDYPQSPWWSDQDIGPLLVHYQVLSRTTVNTMPVARECVAYWGVTTYNATARSGRLYEELYLYTTPEDVDFESETIHSFTNTTAVARTYYGQRDNITIIPPRSWLNGTEQTADLSMRTFTVSADAQRALQNTLTTGLFGGRSLLTGSITRAANSSGQNTSTLAAHLMFNKQDPYNFDWAEPPELFTEPDFQFSIMTYYMGLAVRMGVSSGYGFSYGMTETDTYLLHIR